jgi:hypothetical protein
VFKQQSKPIVTGKSGSEIKKKSWINIWSAPLLAKDEGPLRLLSLKSLSSLKLACQRKPSKGMVEKDEGKPDTNLQPRFSSIYL